MQTRLQRNVNGWPVCPIEPSREDCCPASCFECDGWSLGSSSELSSQASTVSWRSVGDQSFTLKSEFFCCSGTVDSFLIAPEKVWWHIYLAQSLTVCTTFIATENLLWNFGALCEQSQWMSGKNLLICWKIHFLMSNKYNQQKLSLKNGFMK